MTARDWLHKDGVSSDVHMVHSTTTDRVDWIHYRIDDADVYFVSEPNGKEFEGQATFRCQGKIPEFWNAVDGSIREANQYRSVKGGTELPLKLDPFGSIFIVFRRSIESQQIAKTLSTDKTNFPDWQPIQLITGPWDVSFDDSLGGPSQSIRFNELSSWTAHRSPRVKYYSGKALYRTELLINESLMDKDLAIELGSVKDVGIARVYLNGTDLGIVWRPPFRIAIGKAIRPGVNRLQIEVVNSWRNRLIGDRSLPQSERVTRTNIRVKEHWRLEPSGLLGRYN